MSFIRRATDEWRDQTVFSVNKCDFINISSILRCFKKFEKTTKKKSC